MKVCPNCNQNFLNRKRKYCSRLCFESHFRIIYKSHNKIIDINKAKTDRIRKRILLELRGHKCENCLNESWLNKPIPLELEHKDGNADNNDISNLSLLCCNCHAQTDTFKRKNNNIDHSRKKLRRERYKKNVSSHS